MRLIEYQECADGVRMVVEHNGATRLRLARTPYAIAAGLRSAAEALIGYEPEKRGHVSVALYELTEQAIARRRAEVAP